MSKELYRKYQIEINEELKYLIGYLEVRNF